MVYKLTHILTIYICSDLQGMKTNGKRNGDDWILNGSKVFITNGWLADVVVVAAITNPDVKPAHGMSLFLVDDGMPGFKKGSKLNKMGMKSQVMDGTIIVALYQN